MTWTREGMHWMCVCLFLYICVCVHAYVHKTGLPWDRTAEPRHSQSGQDKHKWQPTMSLSWHTLAAVPRDIWGSGPTFPTLATMQAGENSLSLLLFSINMYSMPHMHMWVHAVFHDPVQTFLAIKLALTKTKITVLSWRIPIIAVFPWLRRWS